MKKLEISQIDFRVGMIGKNSSGGFVTLLAYKDSRVDMAMLDTEFGQMEWQCEYKRDSKGVLQCGIGVWCNKKKNWVWKWSNGTESNTEAIKGEYSDAMKRAGFMWGIGRELYDFPFLFCKLKDEEIYEQGGKVKASKKLKPNSWKWEMKNGYIIASDNTGERLKAKLKTPIETPIEAPIEAPPKKPKFIPLDKEGKTNESGKGWIKYAEEKGFDIAISATQKGKEVEADILLWMVKEKFNFESKNK
jgi:hypothetical protein